MDPYEKSNDFGYMSHYQHYAAVLKAGGFKLSSPEQQFLISLIRRETRTTTKTATQTTARRSSKHNIVHSSSRRPQPATAKRIEVSQFCRLRVTNQEEDLLHSLLGNRDVESDGVSGPSAQSPPSDCFSQDAQSPETRHDPDPISFGHAAIVIPFSTDEEEPKSYFTNSDRM